MTGIGASEPAFFAGLQLGDEGAGGLADEPLEGRRTVATVARAGSIWTG